MASPIIMADTVTAMGQGAQVLPWTAWGPQWGLMRIARPVTSTP